MKDEKTSETIRFTQTSPVAAKTRLPAVVVLNRYQASPAELLGVKEHGVYGPVRIDQSECMLETGGQTIASGKIVKRRGRMYFKVSDVFFDSKREMKPKGETK